MKKFDLEADKAGAPVCTRNGRGVRIICTDRRGCSGKIIALIDTGDRECIEFYYADGQFGGYANNEHDLMMRDDDYAEKLARGEYGNHIGDVNEMVEPVVKQNLTTDREYWRYEFAGRAMQGMYARGEWREDVVSAQAVTAADALLAELRSKCERLPGRSLFALEWFSLKHCCPSKVATYFDISKWGEKQKGDQQQPIIRYGQAI